MLKIKNKKAQISELVQDSVCLIVIALILILFFIVSGVSWGWSKEGVETSAEIISLKDQSHYSLQAFLQKPVNIEINGQEQILTIADLIRLSEIDPNYKNILNSELQAFEHYKYIFRTTTEALEVHLDALESLTYPRFYIPSKKPILVVLQIDKLKE